MSSPRRACILGLLLLVVLLAPAAHAGIEDCAGDLTPSNPSNRVVELRFPFATGAESVCIELLDDAAPLTTANFLAYLEAGDYDAALVHRVVPGFVVQGGGFRFAAAAGRIEDIPTRAPVTNEPCTLDEPVPGGSGVLRCSVRGNVRGTLAMAKIGDPECDGTPPPTCVSRPGPSEFPRPQFVNSATNQWFVNLADNRSNLDNQNGGFTVFARVLGDGMATVDRIAALPALENAFYTLEADSLSTLGALATVPVESQPVEPPGGFGCFVLDDLAVPFSSTAVGQSGNPSGAPLPNASEPTGFAVFSGACGTRLATPGAFVGLPATNPTSCSGPERFFAWGVTDDQGQLFFRREVGALVPYELTCSEVQQSLADLAERRAAMTAITAPLLVQVASATVVPEPAAAALGLASIAALGGLVHARRAPRPGRRQ